MTKLIFINYRKSDSEQAALRLHDQLKSLVGAEVFIDKDTEAGEEWKKIFMKN